jgi:tripartite-type tricarboxylate transporter receptor subunit TctC
VIAMKIPRRRFLHLTVGAVALPALARTAQAQAYPTRPITLVVPVAAGGGVDTAARIVAEKLQQELKQPVTVENRPGAGSMIGASFVARASPDGYVLLLLEPGAVLAKWMNKAVPYDVINDFTPIALVATQPLVLFARPSLPVKDVKELIAYARANPGKLSVGTAGVGSPHHLAAAWLNTAAKIEITHVPYRGAAPALNDLLAGQIPLIWALSVSVMPFVEQGKVNALAVSTLQRFCAAARRADRCRNCGAGIRHRILLWTRCSGQGAAGGCRARRRSDSRDHRYARRTGAHGDLGNVGRFPRRSAISRSDCQGIRQIRHRRARRGHSARGTASPRQAIPTPKQLFKASFTLALNTVGRVLVSVSLKERR